MFKKLFLLTLSNSSTIINELVLYATSCAHVSTISACVCKRERRDVSSEPDVHQKKEVSFAQRNDFILLTLAELSEHDSCWHQVRSAREEMTADLHFYPSKNGPSTSNTNWALAVTFWSSRSRKSIGCWPKSGSNVWLWLLGLALKYWLNVS